MLPTLPPSIFLLCILTILLITLNLNLITNKFRFWFQWPFSVHQCETHTYSMVRIVISGQYQWRYNFNKRTSTHCFITKHGCSHCYSSTSCLCCSYYAKTSPHFDLFLYHKLRYSLKMAHWFWLRACQYKTINARVLLIPWEISNFGKVRNRLLSQVPLFKQSMRVLRHFVNYNGCCILCHYLFFNH